MWAIQNRREGVVPEAQVACAESTFHLPPLVPALELPVRPGAPLSKPGSQIVVGFKVGQELSHAGVPREQLSDDASAVGGCAEQVGQQFVAESAGGMSTA